MKQAKTFFQELEALCDRNLNNSSQNLKKPLGKFSAITTTCGPPRKRNFRLPYSLRKNNNLAFNHFPWWFIHQDCYDSQKK